jgi:hypothetical protein
MADTNTPSTRGATGRTPTTGDSSSTRPSSDTRRQSNRENNGSIVDRVKESATAQLTGQKDRGTDALGSVAQAIRHSTQPLRDQQHESIAGFVDRAADQIESWSQRLKQKDVAELLGDIQRLARRQPAVFIGSAFAVGLVAARFLKSSRQDEYQYGSESRRHYGGGAYMGTAHDRSSRDFDAISDVTPTVSDAASATDRALETSASRSRKSTIPTERS